MYYKLDENKNVFPSSIEEWTNFRENEFPTNFKHVGRDIINGKTISTIFIGLNYDFSLKSRIPIVFETMIFDKDNKNIYCNRYSTWQEAEEGHEKAVQWVKDGCKEEGEINE